MKQNNEEEKEEEWQVGLKLTPFTKELSSTLKAQGHQAYVKMKVTNLTSVGQIVEKL